jgi:tetratricopeptide (TPR) repeat protein
MNSLSITLLIASTLLVAACATPPGERAAEMAYDAYVKGHYSHSLPAAQLLIAESPDDPRGYLIAGDSLVRLKRYEDAIPYYEELLKVLDRQPDPLALRAEAAATEFKIERARAGQSWTRKELQAATMERLREKAQSQRAPLPEVKGED